MPTNQMQAWLDSLKNEGKLDSQGVFTLSPEQALKKLAEHQLPFAGAWLLTIIQAAVASMALDGIQVGLGRSATTISFVPTTPWSAQELLDALHRADTESKLPLQYLKRALWQVAVREGRQVHIDFGTQGVGLIWDGSKWALGRVSTGQGVKIRVSHGTGSQSEGLLTCLSNPHREECALQADLLTTRAFSCPVPLALDGRRIDGPQYCPHHGDACGPLDQPSYKIWVRQPVPAELPRLFPEAHAAKTSDWLNSRLFVCAGLHQDAMQGRKMILARPSFSTCSVIEAGVVIEVIRLLETRALDSVGLYVSAADLPKDISGFYCQIDPLRERILLALHQSTPVLIKGQQIMEAAQAEISRRGLIATCATGLLTFGGGLLALIHPMAGMVGAAAGCSAGQRHFKATRAQLEAEAQQHQKDLRSLVERLQHPQLRSIDRPQSFQFPTELPQPTRPPRPPRPTLPRKRQ